MERALRVKVCGLTRREDAVAAAAAGVDAIGLVFAARSKRRVSLAQAADVVAGLTPFVTRVGVFVDAPIAEVLAAVTRLKLDVVQLHGSEDEAYAAELRRTVKVVRALAFADHPDPAGYAGVEHDALMLDGLVAGEGRSFDWRAAAPWAAYPELIVAGGLNAGNVAAAVAALAPTAVDVSTGVETSPGVKSARLIEEFVAAAHGSRWRSRAP